MIEQSNREKIIAHAKEEYPRECCGLLVVVKGREQYVKCLNTADTGVRFVMRAEDYADAEKLGAVTAVVHSHPDMPARASETDLVSCETTGVAWYILSYPNIEWCKIVPTGYRAPLIGRQFAYGILDCFTLIRDWYREERQIELADYPARKDKWWDRGENLFLENLSAWGFSPITDESKLGDVVLMTIGKSEVPNHAGILVGQNLLLHHAEGRLSSRDVYDGFYRANTHSIVRRV